MKSIVVRSIVAALLAAPLGVWLATSGHAWRYILESAPSGQLAYLLAKGFALLALASFLLQAFLGVTRGRFIGVSWSARWPNLHRTLGVVTVCLILGHILLFASAVWMRSGAFPWALFSINLGDGFYKQMISVGFVALVFLLVAVAAMGLRGLRPRQQKMLHRLNLVAVGLAMVHSIAIGTETRLLVVLSVYLFLCSSLIVAIYQRTRANSGRAQRS